MFANRHEGAPKHSPVGLPACGLAPALCVVLVLALGIPGVAGAQAVRELDVIFNVRNTNASRAPCLPVEQDFALKGRLAATNPVIQRGRGNVVTLYVNSAALSGLTKYNFRAVAGYDLIAEMAALGEPSVAFDLPGYGVNTGDVDGLHVCVGSEADMAHQIVQQLRNGSYSVVGGGPAPGFDRVVIAGLSSGSLIAQVEAYSFQDVDGLIIMAWPQPDTGALTQEAGRAALDPSGFALAANCATEHKYEERPGAQGPPHYAWSFGNPASNPPDKYPRLFFNRSEAAVIDAVTANQLLERDPCGDRASLFAPWFVLNEQFLPTINVPVLLVYGENDTLADWKAVQQAEKAGTHSDRSHYSGSPSVKVVCIADAGHILPLQRSRQTLHAELARWLRDHGLQDVPLTNQPQPGPPCSPPAPA